MWVRSVTAQGWGLGNSSESWMMQETPRFLMNKKYLTLLAENHRGGSCTRSHGPRGNAVLHAPRVRRSAGTRESARRRFHAERGNEMISWRRLAWRQRRGVVERVVPEVLFLFLLLLFLLLLIIFLILVLLLLFLPPLCRPPRSGYSAQCWDAGASTTAFPRRAWEQDECVASFRFQAMARWC